MSYQNQLPVSASDPQYLLFVQVTITDMGVQLVASLSLSMLASPGNYQAIQLTTTATDLLHTPKQVGHTHTPTHTLPLISPSLPDVIFQGCT